MPLMIVALGDVIGSMVTNDISGNTGNADAVCQLQVECCPDGTTIDLNADGCNLQDITDFDFLEEAKDFAVAMSIIGLVSFVTNWIMVTCLNIVAENQVGNLYLPKLLSNLFQ